MTALGEPRRLHQRFREIREQPAISAQQVDPKPALNLTSRSQALRMHRHGEPPERIAAALDVPRQEVDLLLKVKAQAYSVEAGNVRHEHEWKIWKDTKLPQGKILIPGVVSHATNVLEHSELVADRIIRFAQVVGRENVIASTDCGLGGRVHPQIAWAKLAALTEGAKLATASLWR